MPDRRRRPSRTKTRSRKVPRSQKRAQGFVGRDSSPVLDRYPPKNPDLAPRGPPAPETSPRGTRGSTRTDPGAPPPTPAPALASSSPSPTGSPSTSTPLITLDRPFDVDEFSALLGETSIRVTVPRESLPEVLRRVTEFMDFGIYVYAVTVRPAPSELLKSFVVELQRVDYSREKGTWVPFVEKGTVNSPFGPADDRS